MARRRPTKEYVWAQGARFGVKASVAGLCLVKLAKTGRVTPRRLAGAAANPKHPLHKVVYDKPVKAAAEAYYIKRAQRIINYLEYRLVGDEKHESRIRAYVSVETDDKPVYVRVEDDYDALLDMARYQLNSWRRRFGTIKEMEPVLKAARLVLDDD